MTVIEHLRKILAESIEGPLADVGVHLTDDRSGYTVARYAGRKDNFQREVIIARDKWWNKNRGRFTVFLGVTQTSVDQRAETNLGYLMEHETQDWKIWATDDAQPFIEMLTRGMRDYGIPWLERLSDNDGFNKWCDDEGN